MLGGDYFMVTLDMALFAAGCRRYSAVRTQGIKLRDATSFGLRGWLRLGVLPPQAQDALFGVICVSN